MHWLRVRSEWIFSNAVGASGGALGTSLVHAGQISHHQLYQLRLIAIDMFFDSNTRCQCGTSTILSSIALVLLGSSSVTCTAEVVFGDLADDREHTELVTDAEKVFRDQVAPFVKKHCIECHQNKRPTEAGVNFSPALQKPGDAAFTQQWIKAVARVKAHDMPPEDAEKQPNDEDRLAFIDGIAKLKFLSPKDPGPFVIRRLNKVEYGNTLRDLWGVDPSIAAELPDEVSGAGYLNSLTPLQMEHYLRIAKKVMDRIAVSNDSSHKKLRERLFGQPPPSDIDSRTSARNVAHSFARKAYRRPPSDAEVDVLLTVFDLGIRNKLDYPASLRLMLEAILVSPQFLFITPADVAKSSADIVQLDNYQLASRLSYLIWATMPDDELATLADSGKLHEPDVFQTQVNRLLMDGRSRALFDGFGAQWLGLGDLHSKTFDLAKYPQMTSELRSAMYDEVRLFFESIVRENHSVVNFVDCDYTFLNTRLAGIYGLEQPATGPSMQRVKLANANRGGVLGMPGILAATSFPNRTSPVKRGVWVLEQILGEHVPTPPPDVPNLEEQDKDKIANLTLRQRTELHRTNAVCANCHSILDPIGFGLENFDTIGRWRDQDETGGAIDAAGELPSGERFASPEELKRILAGRTVDIARNLVRKLLAYALCRNLEGYDEVVVDGLMRNIAADGYRMQTLIREIVTSYPFTHRRIHQPYVPTPVSE